MANKQKRNKKFRIWIGPCEIAGYYSNLAKGFRALGYQCDFITYQKHVSNYGGQSDDPFLLTIVNYLNQLRNRIRIFRPLKICISVISLSLFKLWIFWTIIYYDVFIFSFGQSFSNGKLHLWLIKLLKKKAFVVYNGSDSRPPFSDGFIHDPFNEKLRVEVRELVKRGKQIRDSINRFERMGVIVIGNPFSTYTYVNKDFINFLLVGIPFYGNAMITTSKNEYENFFIHEESVRILHSPSHPTSKGSKIIETAIERLKSKGYRINFIKLVGKSNQEVLNEIQKCDFIVDQVYSDFPLAAFATEAAWCGKPAVVGGYALDYLKNLTPQDMWPPSKTCLPNNIEQAIEELIIRKAERIKLGEDAQKFVQQKWQAEVVASRYINMIIDNFPQSWWVKHQSIFYLKGAGQSIEMIKSDIKNIVEQFGHEGLSLPKNKTTLLNAYLKFADINDNSFD